MPRSFSSRSRSVSWPVSARMSEVLPWSMCPAVPIMRGMSAVEVDGQVGGVEDAAEIEAKATGVDAADDRGMRGAEAGRDLFGGDRGVLDGERAALERDRRCRAAPHLA